MMNVMENSRKIAKNNKMEEKLAELKKEKGERGITINPTNISITQIEEQLRIFRRNSSVTLIDLMKFNKQLLQKAGIAPQLWGGIILRKITESALSKIPAYVKREQNLSELEVYCIFTVNQMPC